MISINEFKVVQDKKIHFRFSDGSEKTVDFGSFIGDDELSKPLSDPSYFRKAELLENGHGIYWSNDFDFCPDFLHQYEAEEQELTSRKG